jgi:hypothetical protein
VTRGAPQGAAPPRPAAGGPGVRGLSALALAVAAAIALVAVPSALPGGGPGTEARGIDARTLWSRVHVIGASASAGFGVRAPVPRGSGIRPPALPLAKVADLALLGDATVTGDATGLFFADPCGTGTAQVDATLEADPRPTIVLADDFLFWFTYGGLDAERKPIKDESQRLALLERGLSQLDRLLDAGLRLVVGDVPDMSESVGRMLTPRQMPAPATLQAANERIRAWAASRPAAALLPLAELVDDLRSGTQFTAGRREWSERADGPLIQRDRLHPTFAGMVALLARTEQSANERFLGAMQPNAPGAPAAFEHDPAAVGDRVRESVAGASAP